MITKIKKGNRFICIKDVVMDEPGCAMAYKAGKVYECKSIESIGCNLPSEIYGTHTWDLTDNLFSEHFIPYTYEALSRHYRHLTKDSNAKPFSDLLRDMDSKLGKSTGNWKCHQMYASSCEACVCDPVTQHEMTVEDIRMSSADAEVIDQIASDPVNHPSHYTDGNIEVIDFIEDKRFGYNLGNAVKYISRAGKKDASKTVQDLQKAVWYVQREIARLQGGKETSCE